jgi:hypothetical protein
MPTQSFPLEKLSDLDSKLLINFALGSVFSGIGPRSSPARQLTSNLVRLTDKVVFEHEAARAELQRYLNRRSLSSFFRGQGHLETCVQSLHRALNFAEALRRRGLQMTTGEPVIPRCRDVEVLSNPVRTRIKNFRDAIEHTDERLIKSGAPVGQVTALNPSEAGISLEGVSITYSELALWIRQLHGIAVRLNHYQETPAEST